jgi:hypothetical protein
MWSPSKAMTVVWEPSAYQQPDAQRVNLSLRAEHNLDELRGLDAWVLATAAEQSERLFGKRMTAEQLQDRYLGALKANENGAPLLRLKMNVAGRNEVRCWNEARMQRAKPESWLSCMVRPVVRVRALWFMSREFGVLLEITDALLEEASKECPF